MNKLRSQPAYSLIFAFIIMTVMMLVAGTAIQNTNDKIAYYRDLEGGTKAYLAAQSAAEMGVLAMKDFNPGYESSMTDAYTEDRNGDGTNETYADYTIYGNASENDFDATGTWYIPIPGTGTVADRYNCTILDHDYGVSQNCNWNKLLYGESVSVPLFTDDGSGGLLFPADLGFTSWSLKVRTPCDSSIPDNDDPDTCTRYEFKTSDTTTEEGDSVIFWQLTGTDASGNAVGLVPDDDLDRNSSTLQDDRDSSDINNEIYESKINDRLSSGHVVLQADSTSDAYSPLYDFCMRTDLESLYLQMDIVTPLIDTSDVSIPYLEWQMTIDSTSPFADNKSVIVGEGYYQGTEHTFYYPFIVTRSTTGESSNVYTLSN